MVECAFHFWRTGISTSEMNKKCVDYIGGLDVMSAHPAFTGVATNIPGLSINEVFHGYDLSESGGRQIMRPEPKDIVFM